MLKKFISLCLIFILVGGGFILYRQPSMLNQITKDLNRIPAIKNIDFKDIKGLSTTNPDKVPKQVKSQVDKKVKEAEKQVRDVKVGDVMDMVDRVQKFTKDFRAFQENIKKEIENFSKQPKPTTKPVAK